MNGAESLVQTAVNAGIEVCFANPGTTEMPIVTALDSVPGIRAILGLFEGVCTGAADGYARMTGRPALTLLHLGPGFANGIANLHNARRARVAIVNLIGDHASWHLQADAPLTSDIVSLARPVSNWIRTARSARSLAADTAEAIAASLNPPGSVSSLIIPADSQWGESEGPAPARTVGAPQRVPSQAVAEAFRALSGEKPAALILGGSALREDGLRLAARIADATSCTLLCETFPTRMERGLGLPEVEKIPYFPDQALRRLSAFDTLVIAGAAEPVAFFGYPGFPSRLVPAGCASVVLARPGDDVLGALDALLQDLPAGDRATPKKPPVALERVTGDLTPDTLGLAIASVQPQDAIIFDESATSGFPYFLASAASAPHTYLSLVGGAIGQGLPCATGAAVACPDRKVIALQADGSGMYTLQALWTQAREGLDVKTVVCANRSYRVLRLELARAGITEPGAQTCNLTDLARPHLDWVHLARGMGVPAVSVARAEDLTRELGRALAEPGPYLIEALL